MHTQIDLIFFELDTYTAFSVLGVILGCLVTWLYLQAHSRRASALGTWLDGAMIVFVFGWLGARLYHVTTNWDYFAARPEEILQPGLGGLGMRGAFIVGGIALAIYTTVKKIAFWHFADAAGLGLALGQAMGWVGALQWGANYGVVSDSQIAVDLPDLYGLIQPRFPVQHIEVAFFVLLFAALLIMTFQSPPKGTVFVAYLIVNSLAQFALGFARGDATAHIGILRVDQVVDLGFMTCGVGIAAVRRIRTNELFADGS